MEAVWIVPQPLCRAITSKDTTEATSCPSSLRLCCRWGWEWGTTRSLCSLQQHASLGRPCPPAAPALAGVCGQQ